MHLVEECPLDHYTFNGGLRRLHKAYHDWLSRQSETVRVFQTNNDDDDDDDDDDADDDDDSGRNSNNNTEHHICHTTVRVRQ